MALTIKLQDATVSLGGEFSSALAFVKSLPGRKYDGATKTNSAAMTLKEFSARAQGRPFDVQSAAQSHRSGEHVTRWGTRYSRNEWDAMRAADKAAGEAAHAARPQVEAAEREIRAELQRRALENAPSAEIARKMAALVEADGGMSEAIERRLVKFSTPERESAWLAIDEWYWDAMWKAGEVERDAEAAARERVNDTYGIY